MKKNVILDKSYAFSIRIINLYKNLNENKKEYVLSKQILRSGTSIGANIEEAVGGYSTKEFLSKLTITYKEARETNYWIRLLRDTKYIETINAESLINDCEEIQKILSSIQKTIKKNINNS